MNTLTLKAGEELVRALITIEHDGQPRVPGTDSAIFPIDSQAAEALEKLQYLVRGDAVHQAGAAGSGTVEAADEGGHEQAGLLADLSSAQHALEGLSAAHDEALQKLTERDEALAELREQLDEAVDARLQADQHVLVLQEQLDTARRQLAEGPALAADTQVLETVASQSAAGDASEPATPTKGAKTTKVTKAS